MARITDRTKTLLKKVYRPVIWLLIGVIIGGYLFRDVQPRSFLAADQCNDHCANTNDFLGLLAAGTLLNADALIPKKVMETETVFVVEHPQKEAPIHYVILPKRDIRNVGELSAADRTIIIDMHSVMAQLIREKNLKRYQIITNGPAIQHVTYLHYHLLGSQ